MNEIMIIFFLHSSLVMALGPPCPALIYAHVLLYVVFVVVVINGRLQRQNSEQWRRRW
jgi:hypothetical protein